MTDAGPNPTMAGRQAAAEGERPRFHAFMAETVS
jgi:hypothetical protein